MYITCCLVGNSIVLQQGRAGLFLLPLFRAVFLTLVLSPTPIDIEGYGMETKGRIKCLEENCKFYCHYTWQLRNHLMQEHAIQMKSARAERIKQCKRYSHIINNSKMG